MIVYLYLESILEIAYTENHLQFIFYVYAMRIQCFHIKCLQLICDTFQLNRRGGVWRDANPKHRWIGAELQVHVYHSLCLIIHLWIEQSEDRFFLAFQNSCTE